MGDLGQCTPAERGRAGHRHAYHRTGRLDRRSTDRTGHRSAAGAGTRVSDRGTAGRGGRAGTGGDGQRTRVCAAGVRSRADSIFG